jgi:hypothetical protein
VRPNDSGPGVPMTNSPNSTNLALEWLDRTFVCGAEPHCVQQSSGAWLLGVRTEGVDWDMYPPPLLEELKGEVLVILIRQRSRACRAFFWNANSLEKNEHEICIGNYRPDLVACGLQQTEERVRGPQ